MFLSRGILPQMEWLTRCVLPRPNIGRIPAPQNRVMGYVTGGEVRHGFVAWDFKELCPTTT